MEEPPPPRNTLACTFSADGMTLERGFGGGRTLVESMGIREADDPKQKAGEAAGAGEKKAAASAEAARALALAVAKTQEMSRAAGLVDEDENSLHDEQKAELVASYVLPPPANPVLVEARNLIEARREPAVIHLRLDASAVAGKANIVGTIRSHADPHEVIYPHLLSRAQTQVLFLTACLFFPDAGHTACTDCS